MTEPLPLLTIAGSDSGGAAGLQADLKTWTALGCYGMSAITAVTAQNSERVAAVHYLPPEMVAAQIDAVLSDYGAAAIKTGFLGRVDVIEAVAERLAYWSQRPDRLAATNHEGQILERQPVRSRPFIVIDPVLVNHRGEAMFGPEVAAAYRELLFPLADLVTPNWAEAGLLGVVGAGEQGRKGAGENKNRRPGKAPLLPSPPAPLPFPSPAPLLLIKGWRQDATEIVDLYWDGSNSIELPQPRIDTANTHGSGDTLSAAICAFRARGHDWLDAIRRAQSYTHEAIRRGADWQLGVGHGPLGH